MERISRDKRKPRISTSVVIICLVLALGISLLFIMPQKSGTVKVEMTGFEDVGQGVYVKYDIENKADTLQICDITVKLPDAEYKDTITIPAHTRENHKILTDMPQGSTKVHIEFDCNNVN